LHKLSSSFVLGYHGCDRAVAERLIAGALHDGTVPRMRRNVERSGTVRR